MFRFVVIMTARRTISATSTEPIKYENGNFVGSVHLNQLKVR